MEPFMSPGGKSPERSGNPFWEEEDGVDPRTPEPVRRWKLRGENPAMAQQRAQMRIEIRGYQQDIEKSSTQREDLMEKSIRSIQDGASIIEDIGDEMARTEAARNAMQLEKNAAERDLGDISDQVRCRCVLLRAGPCHPSSRNTDERRIVSRVPPVGVRNGRVTARRASQVSRLRAESRQLALIEAELDLVRGAMHWTAQLPAKMVHPRPRPRPSSRARRGFP